MLQARMTGEMSAGEGSTPDSKGSSTGWLRSKLLAGSGRSMNHAMPKVQLTLSARGQGVPGLAQRVPHVRQVGHLQVMPEGSLDFGRGQPARYALHDPASLIARITQDATLAPMVAVVTPMLRFSGVAGRFESGASSNFAGIGWDPAMRLKLLEWDGNGLRLPPAASFLRADQPQGGVIGAGLAQL